MLVVPVGHKVKFNLNGQVLEGIVTRYMVPGYVFKHMPGGDNRLRYCIDILSHPRNNCVIFEDQLIDPDYDKLCNDQEYLDQVKLKFQKFTDVSKRHHN